MADGPADIDLPQVDGPAGGRRELTDAQLPIQEHRADVGALQQVVHVVIELGQLQDAGLVLGVDRVELLVDGVQLLVGALELLVGGQQFLVARLLLLVGGLQLLDRGLEVLPGVLKILLELLDPADGLGIRIEGMALGGRPGLGILQDDDEEVRMEPARRPEGDAEVDVAIRPRGLDSDGVVPHRLAVLLRPV